MIILYGKLEKEFCNLGKKNVVCVTTIPPRYDLSSRDPQQDDLAILNNYIKELAARINNVHVIDLQTLKRVHFTKHGLHMNYKGKRKLSIMRLDTLSKIGEGSETCDFIDTEHEQKNYIKVIDANMNQMIKTFHKDKKQSSHIVYLLILIQTVT